MLLTERTRGGMPPPDAPTDGPVTPEGEANLRLHVYDAQGVMLAVDDDSGAGLDPELGALSLPADGLYYLIVEAQGIDAAGGETIPYRLVVTAPDAG